MDVLVSDRGKPVPGLGPADFEVLDNGVPQRVELVSFEQLPLSVVLALDMSDSVVGPRLDTPARRRPGPARRADGPATRRR